VLYSAITTTGSANAYVLTTGLSLNSSPAAYVAGQTFVIKANFTCSGAATINVDTLGAKNLTKNGTTAVASGDIVSGNIYVIAYDGTQFQVLGSVGAGIQPLDATLTAIAGLSNSADQMMYFTAADTVAAADFKTPTNWTPAITFVTNGDLSVTYSIQSGRYIRVGKLVAAFFNLATSAFTHTTASGSIQITGLPVAAEGSNFMGGGSLFQMTGVTKAGYTAFDPHVLASGQVVRIGAKASGSAASNVSAADMPTGGSVNLKGVVIYLSA
jgi:hypothetical protein